MSALIFFVISSWTKSHVFFPLALSLLPKDIANSEGTDVGVRWSYVVEEKEPGGNR